MKKQYKTLLIIGIVLVIVPFLGFPQSWKDFLLFLIGLVLVGIAILYRYQNKSAVLDKIRNEVFAESEGESEGESEPASPQPPVEESPELAEEPGNVQEAVDPEVENVKESQTLEREEENVIDGVTFNEPVLDNEEKN